MPGGFAPRFAIEAGFLILLGVGAGIADLRTSVIVALLAGGWLVVSAIELTMWRAEGRTLTPRVAPPPPPVDPEPEPDVGWPIAEEPEEEPYPLRADSERETHEEAEEYTRVISTPERTSPDDVSQ
jgi:hypothetical protein